MSGLTARQVHVLRLMADGWEMGYQPHMGRFSNAKAWLQRDGVGRGGDAIDLHLSTFNALCDRKLIRSTGYAFPTQTYELTDAGRAARAALEASADRDAASNDADVGE